MNPPSVIRVTADHIARGKRHDAFLCPIALAACEQTGCEPGDLVVGDYIIAPSRAGDISGHLPASACSFERDFDDGLPVEPFEFAVEWIGQDGVDVS